MSEIISFTKVLDHERLCERLAALRQLVDKGRAEAPDGPASPMLAATAAALLADIYRLISREPGARALPCLSPGETPPLRRLTAMLRDGQLALDLFKHAHLDHDDDYGEEWITVEGIEDFIGRRKKLILAP